MALSDNAAALRDRCTRDGLVVPDYGGYCFVNVPGTAANVLGADVGPTLPADTLDGVETDISHVVVILLDSLGWRRWHRDRGDHRFLGRLTERGTLTPLTSVVPSSTASAITTVHTGATPAEHGVFGMHAYLPDADSVLHTFRQEVRADAPEAGAGTPVPANEFVDATPVYPDLEAAGVDTHVVQPAETLGTDYADATFRGATQVPTDGPTETARTVRQVLESADGHSYTYAYASDLDEMSHSYGSDSTGYHTALATVTTAFSRELYDLLDPGVANETLLLVTADHGMIDIEAGPPGCLDVFDIDGLAESLRRSGADRIRPYGDPRVCHLAVEPGREDAVITAAEREGVTAFSKEEAREITLFGPDPGPTFDRRCGDVVITDTDRKLVRHSEDKIVPFTGMHGGLTPEEMLVPFAAARLSRLQ